MRPPISVLRGWDSGALSTAAAQLDGVTQRFDAETHTMVRSVDGVQEHWQGAGAAAAAARAVGEGVAANHVSVAVLCMSDALKAGAPQIASARKHALRVVEDATATGCTVADDATVTAPSPANAAGRLKLAVTMAGGPSSAAAQTMLNEAAQVFAADLGRALDEVSGADARLATALARSLEELTAAATAPAGKGSLSPQVQAIVDGKAQLPADPQELNKFWSTLSAADKDALYDHDHNLGNHDGIPVVDRDHYNRKHLPKLQTQAQGAVDGLRAQHPDWADGRNLPTQHAAPGEQARAVQEYDAWKSRYDSAQTQLAGYGGVSTGVGDSPNTQPPKYLMGIDNQGRGIVATGNPDTAKNVATFVPGTGSKLSGIGGDLERSQRMLDAANKRGSNPTAVVTWYGYNAPAGLTNATGLSYAQAGAPALSSFQNGLRATHEGPPSHNVLVGHSYGSTLIGTAASGTPHLNADDVVFVGSPGANAYSVDGLHLDGVKQAYIGQHAYATAAQQDPLPLFAATEALGRDPAGPPFGARTFSSDSGTLGWLLGYNKDVHSQYWDKGNKSLDNLGLIIAGQGARVS